jgi:hypothetical protein
MAGTPPHSFICAVFRGAFGNVHSEIGKLAGHLPVCRAAVFQPLFSRSRPSR